MEVNVRTQKAFVRGYYTVKVSYTIVPWKKKMGLRYTFIMDRMTGGQKEKNQHDTLRIE